MNKEVSYEKGVYVGVSLMLDVGFQLGSGVPAMAQKRFLTLASGSPEGHIIHLGAEWLWPFRRTTDLRCAAESTGASVENCRLVGAGESDMGMVMGSIAYNALQGKNPLKKNILWSPYSRCIRLLNTF